MIDGNGILNFEDIPAGTDNPFAVDQGGYLILRKRIAFDGEGRLDGLNTILPAKFGSGPLEVDPLKLADFLCDIGQAMNYTGGCAEMG